MKLKLNEAQMNDLKRFLENCEDAEQLSAREYVVDLYDIEKPLTLNLVMVKSGVGVDGAAELLYDEAQDGWYMGQRIEEASEVLKALSEAGAIGL